MPSGTLEVEQFLSASDHPMLAEIRRLRAIILAADERITEQIKWNAPSFGFAGQDRVTMRLHPKGYLQLILHRGAKVKASDDFTFTDESGLLEWAAPDRAVVTFKTAKRFAASEAALAPLVVRWMETTAE